MKNRRINYIGILFSTILFLHPVAVKADVLSTLQSLVNSLTTASSFQDVVAADTKVTEAAAANLITPDEFETLDVHIRTIYRTSTAFSVLGYGNMPNNTAHSVRGSSCVIKWHNNNPCQGAIKITNGATVVFITEDDNISQRIYRDGSDVWPQALITVEKGSTLIIKGSKEHPLIIDGSAVLSGTYSHGGELSQLHMTTAKSGPLVRVIDANSKIMASNATFQNNYCNAPGSGILFGGDIVYSNNIKTASFFQSNFHDIWTQTETTGPNVGGAIYSCNATYQNVTLADGSTNHGILMNHCHFMGNVNDNDPRPGENAKLQNGGSCFAVQGGTLNLCIKNSLLESNFSSWHGGAIFWNITSGTLNLEGTTFSKNYAGLGGAVYVQGNLDLNDCTFTDNHAVIQNKNQPGYVHPAYVQGNGYDGCGGALYIQPSNAGGEAANCNLNLNNCVFDGNSADLDGGAILLYMVQNTNASAIHDVNVSININGTTERMLVQNNTAGRVGGALALTVANELIDNIKAYNLNASIHLNGGRLYNNSVSEAFDNDRATFQGKGYGGGLFLHYAPVTICDGFEIVENTSVQDGGALYVANGNVTAGNMLVSGNETTAGDGGGIYVNGGNVTISGGSVSGNSSVSGGGVYVNDGNFTFTSGNVEGNTASKNGGGAYVSGGIVTFKGSLRGNTAANGGGLYLGSGANMTFKGGLIIENQAEIPDGATSAGTAYHGSSANIMGCGGGIYLQNGTSSKKTTLTFDLDPNDKTFGLYTNRADMAGDDLVAEGQYTEVVLPSVREMQLYGFEGKDATPFWYQDYFYEDKGYDLANGHAVVEPVRHVDRYREIIRKYTNDYLDHRIPDDEPNLNRIKNNYLCLTLSYNMLDITISALHLLGHETALFRLVRHGGTEDYNYDVLLRADNKDSEGKSSRTLRNMPWGTYSIFPNDAWNWAYDKIPPQQNLRLGETGNYEFVFDMNHINGAEVPQHDERQPVRSAE